MTPTISIIMPIYNTGEVLGTTIESILNQSFGDFELILVDDGSTDGSSARCDEYAARDERIRVVHQKNLGICGGRNTGISMAQGKYITFCDHDDIYRSDKLKVSYELAEKYNADIVNVGYENLNDNGHTYYGKRDVVCENKEQLKEHFFDIAKNCISVVWTKLFRVSTLKEYLVFDTKYKRGHEDVNFMLKIMPHVNVFVSTSEVLYLHLIRGSLSTSAKIHDEVIIGMTDAITNYCDCVGSMDIDIKKRVNEYAYKLAEYVRTLMVYMAKTDFRKKEYVATLSKLKYTPTGMSVLQHLKHNGIATKDKLALLLFEKKQYSAMYFVAKLFLKSR